jgi:hypothetical protein
MNIHRRGGMRLNPLRIALFLLVAIVQMSCESKAIRMRRSRLRRRPRRPLNLVSSNCPMGARPSLTSR